MERGKITVQVKICGLTRPDEAVACAEAGADAIGLVFFPKSPRNVELPQAEAICRALGTRATTMGVFVNAGFEEIMIIADTCGLNGVQLHGQEDPETVAKLCDRGLKVVKVLFANRKPGFEESSQYAPTAFLAECAGGKLPGGNALAWDWGTARDLGRAHPLVLAGGLDPENVGAAIAAAGPAAVDVSSGVEASPGRKDLNKVARFIAAVQRSHLEEGHCINKIFRTAYPINSFRR